jgi:hypothetical protein
MTYSKSLAWTKQSQSRLPWALMIILILIWDAHRLIKRYIAIYATFYPYFMILMVPSYIYICFVFQNLSMCLTYIYYIGSMPKSVEYQFFMQFLKFPELPRQFSSDMFGLWPEHIQLVGHVQLLTQTCLSLRFPTYIRGLSPPPPLRTLGFFFSSTPSLATTNGSLGNFGSSPLNPFSF